ncbi:MAG: hypothetical protein GY851_18115 [bacterium]|nr:hypothetical protein [bacterium]
MLLSVALLGVWAVSGAAEAVDSGGPLPEHNLRFETAVTVWDEALPLGNGLLGALVWGDGKPLNISLNRTDLWDVRPVPEFHSDEYSYATMREWEKAGRYDDLSRVYEKPYRRPAPTKIPAGRLCVQLKDQTFKETELDLATAQASVSFGSDVSARVWIHAEQQVGVLEVDGALVWPELVAPAFGGKEVGETKPAIVAGDVAQLGYPPPTIWNGEDYAAYEQEGWDGFSFAVYVGWRYDEAPTRTASAKRTLAVWTVASSLEEGGTPLDLARARVEGALKDDVEALRSSHRAWWDAFWGNTWLRVPNARVERQWYLDTYKFGAAARVDTPPITLQGPWTADDGKLPPWKGDYHHDCNTEMSYWPSYSGNRMDGAQGFVDWLWEHREACVEWTRRFFDMPGMNVPMTTDLNCEQIGGWRQYTHAATTAAWLAQHFYWHWKYGTDAAFLETRAYPYVRDCAVFIEAVTNERDADGMRTLPLSSSPEFNDNKPNAWFPSITNNDLALIRWLFGAAEEMAGKLGKTEDAARWNKALGELPELSVRENGALMVAKDFPYKESHRHFSHLMAIYPMGILDLSHGEEDARIIKASMAELLERGSSAYVGFSFSWQACLAARARDGATAEKALDIFAEAFVLRNGFNCNGDQSGKGYSNYTYRPFTLEANYASAAGLQEMLLQSHTGIIEVFPAIPEGWKNVAFRNLRAQGAFLVSAERKGGEVTALRVQAERGGSFRLRSRRTGEVVEMELGKGEKWEG